MRETTNFPKIRDFAQSIIDNTTVISVKNSNGYREQRTIWRPTAPAELQDWWRDESGEITDHNVNDMDEIYMLLTTVASIVIDRADEATINDIGDDIYAYDFADVYNADRLYWLLENLSREEDCNEVADERDDQGGVYDRIAWGQQWGRERYAIAIYDAMLGQIGLERE